MARAEFQTLGPHFYFVTALRTFCLQEVAVLELYGVHPVTCEACGLVLARYKLLGLVDDGVRCRGTTRNGHRCQRDAVDEGFCPSHYSQAADAIRRAVAVA